MFLTLFLWALFLGFFGAVAYVFWVMRETWFSSKVNQEEWIKFNDPELKAKYANRKIPMETLYEAYFDEKVDFLGNDLFSTLKNRDKYVSYAITPSHLKWLVTRFLPEVLVHSKEDDKRMVQWHYDRGDDFFGWFLGERMVYTSAKFETPEGKEGLEKGQDQKMEMVCKNLQLKKGDRHLDIGCGWGTLVRYASQNFGSDSTGVTISENQTIYGNGRIKEVGLENQARLKCLDYRDIPNEKWDKISCMEMAEHVGVKNFMKFLRQCNDLLEDDGIFVIQMCGLRRNAKWRDLIWGMFMNKYIFPGADASTPLGYIIDSLEKAGFEIVTSENLSYSYSTTIYLWYLNWMKNREDIINKYGIRWFRIWEMFLAWSVLIAREGTAAVFQITCTKNLDHSDRARFVGQL